MESSSALGNISIVATAAVYVVVGCLVVLLPALVVAFAYTTRRSKTENAGDSDDATATAAASPGTTQKSSQHEVHKQHERTEGAEQVLITGGAGFLGSYLVDELVRRPATDVHVFDLRLPDSKRRRPRVASYIRGDVTDREHVTKALAGIHTVFHVAGVSSHDLDVAVTKEMTHKINVTGTENIVRACKENGVKKLIFTSTCIATLGKNDREAKGWTETQPYPEEPVNEYASSKIAAEKIVRKANGRAGLATCVVRPAGMFGIGDNIMADMALRGKDNYFIGDGTAHLDVIDVYSAVHGHLCAAKHLSPAGNKPPIAAGKTYNITGGRPVMYKEFFGGLCKGRESFWGHRPPKKIPVQIASLFASINEIVYNAFGVVPFARSLTKLSVDLTQRTYWFDNSLAAKEIGYSPLKSWRNAVDDVVKDYRHRSSPQSQPPNPHSIP